MAVRRIGLLTLAVLLLAGNARATEPRQFDYMLNCQDPANSHFTHLEEVHFTYRKITWTHEVCGTSGSDDWRTPVVG